MFLVSKFASSISHHHCHRRFSTCQQFAYTIIASFSYMSCQLIERFITWVSFFFFRHAKSIQCCYAHRNTHYTSKECDVACLSSVYKYMIAVSLFSLTDHYYSCEGGAAASKYKYILNILFFPHCSLHLRHAFNLFRSNQIAFISNTNIHARCPKYNCTKQEE